MPLSATVTPLSLYMLDNTVFDGLQLPTMPQNPTSYPDLYVEGFALDREVLVNNILMETGELDCIYPDPDFFKFAVTQWSKKELPVWQALYNTLFYKYNPLWNKDGAIKEMARDLTDRITTGNRSRSGSNAQHTIDAIDETDTHGLKDTRTPELVLSRSESAIQSGTSSEAGTGTSNETHSGAITTNSTNLKDTSNTSAESETSAGSTANGGTVITVTDNDTETKVSGYNETSYQNRDKTENDVHETVTDTTTKSTEDARDRSQTDMGTESTTESRTETDTRGILNSSTTETTKTDDSTSAISTDQTETGRETIDHTGTLRRTGNNSRTYSGDESEDETSTGTDSGILDHDLTRTETGNIGVTMTTQLIAAQRELVQFNFYDLIVKRFKERFCLLVY